MFTKAFSGEHICLRSKIILCKNSFSLLHIMVLPSHLTVIVVMQLKLGICLKDVFLPHINL